MEKLKQSQIPRNALMKMLDGLAFSKKQVIYMHAPAGFGKTTSSLLWLEHREQTAKERRVWLGFDEYDNKTSEFCRRFISVLAAIQPENAPLKELLTHLNFHSASAEFALRALSAFNEAGEDSYIFAFDDLHVISSDEILKLLLVLIKRLPKNCKVLLLSRTVPPDCFSEMIIKDELTVIGAGDLQFSCEEIKVFFNNNGKQITKIQANEVLKSTGGWAIGIRTLLLSDEKSYSVNLSSRYLESFLKTHVWERWDERLKRFMTLISVTEDLTPELCDFLTDMPSAEMLTKLVQENAFLRITGDNTYRFHDLFREFLLHILESSGEAAVNKQRNKAGDYFFNKKDYSRSVEHYLKGKNDEGVAKSLYHMYDYNSPYASIEDTLYTVHSSVNDSIVKKFPFLLEVQAWGAFVEGRADDLEAFLDKYYKLSPKIILKNPRSVTTLVFLRCMDYRESFIQTMKTLKRIPFKGNFKAAMPSVTHSMPLFHRSSRDFSELVHSIDNNISLIVKNFKAVLGKEARVLAESLQAGLLYEKGYLNEAHEHALTACSNITGDCAAEIKFCAMMILTSVLYADSQNSEADKVINNVREMIERDKAFYLNANLKAFLFRQRLSEGDKSTAIEWLKDCNGSLLDNLSFFKIYQYFTTARAYIVIGDYTNAVLLLRKLLELNERYRRTLDIIEACILLAIIYWKKSRGGQPAALDYLERAIITAYEYKYTQVFANEGAELINMLHRLQKRSVQEKYAGELHSGFVKTLYIAAVAGGGRSKGLTGGRSVENLKFTEKQKAIMALMSEGYSRNKIAEKTGLKPNTVKSHLELIYKKLDVSNSIEAALKIKKLDVL
jgi:LuxR family maltose regulon positive regulatory protein